MPDQKASIAVPLSALAMIGRATESEVASSAAAKVTTEREQNARTKRQFGSNSSVASPAFSEILSSSLDIVGPSAGVIDLVGASPGSMAAMG